MFGPRFFGPRMFGPRYWGVGAEAVDAALTIDGITVQLLQGAHTEATVPLGLSGESYEGHWQSGRGWSAPHDRTRDWPGFETPSMAIATALTLEAALKLPGRRTAAGYLVSSTTGIAVYVEGLERVWRENSNELGLRFGLRRADP